MWSSEAVMNGERLASYCSYAIVEECSFCAADSEVIIYCNAECFIRLLSYSSFRWTQTLIDFAWSKSWTSGYVTAYPSTKIYLILIQYDSSSLGFTWHLLFSVMQDELLTTFTCQGRHCQLRPRTLLKRAQDIAVHL